MGAYFVGALAIFCLFGLPVLAIAFVLVKKISSDNKERLELARHGIIPSVKTQPSPNKYCSLRNGILCIGIATGLIAGILLIACEGYAFEMEFLILCSSVILCLGLSYIVFYRIVKNRKMDSEDE